MSIVAVGLVATAYTLMGGLAAVVWTDFLQFVVVIAGVVLCAAHRRRRHTGRTQSALHLAREHGRLKLVDLSFRSSSVRSVAGAVLGYGILSLSVAGTNQQPVQRYLACKSTADARRAALTGWAVGLFVTLITLLLGVLFFAFYQAPRARALPGLAPDAIFPRFAADHLPAGILGLAVAAIFAAAMSSLDSALHSLSTSSVVDLYRRFFSSNRSDMHYLKVARGATLSLGSFGNRRRALRGGPRLALGDGGTLRGLFRGTRPRALPFGAPDSTQQRNRRGEWSVPGLPRGCPQRQRRDLLRPSEPRARNLDRSPGLRGDSGRRDPLSLLAPAPARGSCRDSCGERPRAHSPSARGRAGRVGGILSACRAGS